jgi:hypothetical protein
MSTCSYPTVQPDAVRSNNATTAAWTVDNVRETVRDPKANGVTSFQQYDAYPTTRATTPEWRSVLSV